MAERSSGQGRPDDWNRDPYVAGERYDGSAEPNYPAADPGTDPLYIIIVLAFWRLVLEFFIVAFRISDDIRALRERSGIR